jgi:hypothetical protein
MGGVGEEREKCRFLAELGMERQKGKVKSKGERSQA